MSRPLGSFFYIIRNGNGGIEQGELPAQNEVDASHRLIRKVGKPYELVALQDQTLDKAILNLEQYLEQRKRRDR